MFFDLHPQARRFQQALEHAFALALLGTTLAAVAFTLLFLLRHTFTHGITLWLVSMLYLAVRIGQTGSLYSRVQRGALEARLIRQPLDARTLAQCLARTDHLWAQSRVLEGIRQARLFPSPGRLRPSEQQRRLYSLYTSLLAPLRPSLLRPNLLILLALFGLWASQTTAEPVQFGYAIGLTALLGVIELVEVSLLWRVQENVDSLVTGLSKWTLAYADAPSLTADLPRPYGHERLYLDQPWAHAPAAPAQ